MLTICSGGHAMFLHSGRSTSPSSADTTPCTIATYRFRTSRSRNCPDERNSTCEQASLQTIHSCAASGHRSAASAIAPAAKLQYSTRFYNSRIYLVATFHNRINAFEGSATCKRPALLYQTTQPRIYQGFATTLGGHMCCFEK